MNEIRWTDKVYLDGSGNICYSTNADIVTKVNAGLVQPVTEVEDEQLE